MQRLLVNPGSAQAWEIVLEPGIYSIGRGVENSYTIDHESISTFHARVTVEDEAVWVEDRGSANGTFINDEFVREGMLRPGDRLQLGSITMVLENPEPSHSSGRSPADERAGGLHVARSVAGVMDAPDVTQTVEPVEEPRTVFCKNHFQNLARFKCIKCSRYVCDLCVNTRGTAGGGKKFCKICGTECAPVVFAEQTEVTDFFREARLAFRYPVMGDGLFLLFGGFFFFGFLDLANYVSRHSFQYALRAMMMRVTIFTFIFGTGYLFAYLKKIIAATADGDATMPDWPELSEWTADIVSPMFQFLLLTVLCFGPSLALYLWLDGDHLWLVWLAALAGCAYFPMAFLGIAMFDSLTALHPKFIIGSALRVRPEYAVAVAVFAGTIATRGVLETLLGKLMHVPLAPALLADLAMIYLLMVEARILGMLYFTEKDTLAWFRRR